MDVAGVEGRDDERDRIRSDSGEFLRSLGERQQPRHPVLGRRTGHHHHNDDIHDSAIDLVDHNLDTVDHDHGTYHHHHGPRDNDIIVHDHVDTGAKYDNDFGDHNHIVTAGIIDYFVYGPADHDHNPADSSSDGNESRGCRSCGAGFDGTRESDCVCHEVEIW